MKVAVTVVGCHWVNNAAAVAHVVGWVTAVSRAGPRTSAAAAAAAAAAVSCRWVAAAAAAAAVLIYDGGRQVTVYIPADPPEAVVFAGDGQLISQWGGVLEAADVPSTMIVGVHRLADETLRLHEYSPGFEPARFAAHEAFFVEDVRQWTRSRFGVVLPAERTAVFGVSAGGELALAIGLRHPDVYGQRDSSAPSPGSGLPTAGRDAESDSAYVPRCRRHAGAVFPREREPVGDRAARCGRRRCHDGASRAARRRVLARRIPAHGGVGVWTVRHRDLGPALEDRKSTRPVLFRGIGRPYVVRCLSARFFLGGE